MLIQLKTGIAGRAIITGRAIRICVTIIDHRCVVQSTNSEIWIVDLGIDLEHSSGSKKKQGNSRLLHGRHLGCCCWKGDMKSMTERFVWGWGLEVGSWREGCCSIGADKMY